LSLFELGLGAVLAILYNMCERLNKKEKTGGGRCAGASDPIKKHFSDYLISGCGNTTASISLNR
jgi:hypothetical protein